MDNAVASNAAVPQPAGPIGPRPLPLFLALVADVAARDPMLARQTLAGLRRYQDAPRPAARPVHPAAGRAGRTRLLDYGGEGDLVVFVPSLINPPFVLDLAPGNSLIAEVRAAGLHPFLLDWGTPGVADSTLDMAAHVTEFVEPLLASLGAPAHLVGYCLGGTLALAAAQRMPARSLSLLATPWEFSAYPNETKAMLADLWAQSRGNAELAGHLPMETLQMAFWGIDGEATVRKFAALADADETQFARFVVLEDWANAGPPLPFAAARDVFERWFSENEPGRGAWRIEGVPVAGIPVVPACHFRPTRDRIVPAASAPSVPCHDVPAGHVGMVVGRDAPTLLWRPLIDWLRRASQTQ